MTKDNELINSILLRESETMNSLLASGASVHARDTEHEETALMLAVQFGSYEMIAKLIEAGAQVNDVDERGRTALSFISNRYFLKEKSELPAILELLFDNGADLNQKDNDGQTALMRVIALTADVEITRTFLNHGARIDVVDTIGDTPESLAESFGLISISQLLQEYKTGLNKT